MLCKFPDCPHLTLMDRPIIPAILPENAMPTEGPLSFTPESLNFLNEVERRSPKAKEFYRRMHETGGTHVTWLVWPYRPRTLWTPRSALLFRQASIFFLDCGRGPFAVTADHVYEKYLEDCDITGVDNAQFANVGGFKLKERLIARGTNVRADIATFQIAPDEIAAAGKQPVRGIDGAWPPPPDEGQAVYIGGFPACEHDRIAGKDVSFALHSAIVPLTRITEHQLCCQFDRKRWFDIRGAGLPPVGYEYGGMSGGPMLQPTYDHERGTWGWRLVGVVSEALSVEGFERITAVRAHLIMPDGRIG